MATAERFGNLFTLDYLEHFCQNNSMIIGCVEDDREVWISPFGAHGHSLSRDQIHEILDETVRFEIIEVIRDLDIQYSLSREELETQLKTILN